MTSLGKFVGMLRDRGFALLCLRLVLGFGFIVHGYAKLERGPDKFALVLASLGVPAPGAAAWLTTAVEILGGVALMLGALTAVASIPLGIIMVTAMLAVHMRYGFSSVRLKAFGAGGAEFGPVGVEVNLLYLAGLAALVLGGTTPWSVDRWLERRRTRSAGKA